LNPVLDIKGLTRRFGRIEALKGLDLTIDQPKMFGIVGPDGAGKTTLLRAVCGLLGFEAERCKVLEYELPKQTEALRRTLGYVPQNFSLYRDLTVDENLLLMSRLHSIPSDKYHQRSEKLLKINDMERFRDRLAGDLSGGMKQKLAVSCALLPEPRLMVLDEANNGVDVIARAEIIDLVRNRENTLVLWATNYLHEAEICDELIYLHEGRILIKDTPQNIKKRFPYVVWEAQVAHPEKWLKPLADDNRVLFARRRGDAFSVVVKKDSPEASDPAWLEGLAPDQTPLVSHAKADLELAFLRLVREAEGAVSA